ncbi:hypothetical protein V3851_18325 [Paenibacillus sp. M1]|uniref:Uncharacterized protein n=1 Tax=Paenibacillus haidiansis TaxID=1574488 RepID=A0ABU7VVK5_9BACL
MEHRSGQSYKEHIQIYSNMRKAEFEDYCSKLLVPETLNKPYAFVKKTVRYKN